MASWNGIPKPPYDSNGTPFKKGSKVVFNCSGDLIEGIVDEFKESVNGGCEHPKTGKSCFIMVKSGNSISRVRQPSSIFVLK